MLDPLLNQLQWIVIDLVAGKILHGVLSPGPVLNLEILRLTPSMPLPWKPGSLCLTLEAIPEQRPSVRPNFLSN
jgi:hypothetical protein